MVYAIRVGLVSILALLALPAAANAANVTVSGGTLTYNAAAGETNTAIVVKQTTTAVATVYFVGDQNPAVTVTASPAQGCLPTSPALGLPAGYLCTVTIANPLTSIVENLGDGDDTGVIRTEASGPAGTINGGAGDDTLVGGRENDTFTGGADTDSVAYVGIADAGITRTVRGQRDAARRAATPSTGNGRGGRERLDRRRRRGARPAATATTPSPATAGPNTIAGSAPPGHAQRRPAARGHREHGHDQRGRRRRHLARRRQRRRERRRSERHDRRAAAASPTPPPSTAGPATTRSSRGSADDDLAGGAGVQHPRLRLRQPGRAADRPAHRRRPRPASRAGGDRARREHRRPGGGRDP